MLAALGEASERTRERLIDEMSGHDRPEQGHALAGDSIRFFEAAARFARRLLASQRFVPSVSADRHGALRATWIPWLNDDSIAEPVALLLAGAPPLVRAVDDDLGGDAAAVLQGFLIACVDGAVRRSLAAEDMIEALEDWQEAADPHVAWLGGLLGPDDELRPGPGADASLLRTARRWIAALEQRGPSGAWQLSLRLNEPPAAEADLDEDDLTWTLTFHLEAVERPGIVVDAPDIWAFPGETFSVDGVRLDAPHELLLTELSRASRVYPLLERALDESNPSMLELSTAQAYEFLRDVRPLLLDQGFGAAAPEWWDSPAARVGARLTLTAPGPAPAPNAASDRSAGAPALGLATLVSYQWRLAVGDTPLSVEEFERLARRAPLVRINGQWVEIRKDDLAKAVGFLKENPGGDVSLGEAIRLGFMADASETGLNVLGVDAEGWLKELFEDKSASLETFESEPEGFVGSLRPYQLRGLSWLAFLDRLGLGPCLADDMGLGKTIQLLALLAHEKHKGLTEGPTLIVVPMSIVGNWARESARFTPDLSVLIHHGPERAQGESFLEAASRADIVLTTYALANRDREVIECVRWSRVVLDEAQNIKNPGAKQSQAIRGLEAPRRAALTGTPLENRLGELWSIIDFCNPGLLGSNHQFKRHFATPIERNHDRRRAEQLRNLVRPFILRRLKTDSSVISDLPEKVETKEFCRLTAEQAELYESCVRAMLDEVEGAEGIRRRGVVLTSLVRLKQICDHPALVAGDDAQTPDALAARRSGKCIRLLELLDEVMASGERALVFTQFRQMGKVLAGILQHTFDRDVLFLHGGTPQKLREKMVARFQSGDPSCPIFLLSLKAGGVGLNLTAASHVVHFDRWWNPAVENQATDRAFRIGQTRTVNVHKFIVAGTLEDRIDEMIDAKLALAEDVIGSGEEWLTELSTSQLQDILTLRPDTALQDEAV